MMGAFTECVLNRMPTPLHIVDTIATLTMIDETRWLAGITFTIPLERVRGSRGIGTLG